jgi:hypothetical protein
MTKSSVSMAINASHTLDSPCEAMLMASQRAPHVRVTNLRVSSYQTRVTEMLESQPRSVDQHKPRGEGRIEGREHSSKCCQTVVQRSSLHGLCVSVMLQ